MTEAERPSVTQGELQQYQEQLSQEHKKRREAEARTGCLQWLLVALVLLGVIVGASAALRKKVPEPDPFAIMCPSQRVAHLLETRFWPGAKPRLAELLLALGLVVASVFVMSKSYKGDEPYPDEPQTKQHLNYEPGDDAYKHNTHRLLHHKKTRTYRALFRRDTGPLSFDVATHHDRAEVTEYRGLLHWHRDVIEKLLSLFLVAVFSLFLAKACGYVWDICAGQSWRLVYLALDVSILISITGFALILDGLILVAAMTDAPGIGRTIDSLIVVLAGVTVLMIDAQPSGKLLVTFSLGERPEVGAVMAAAIGLLFIVRWVIRHHTWSDFMGTQD